MKFYNEEVIKMGEEVSIKCGHVCNVSPEYYEEFVNFPDKLMEYFIQCILYGGINYINGNIDSGAFKTEDDLCHCVMAFMQLLAEGKILFREDDCEYLMMKAVGEPPTEEMQMRIYNRINELKPMIREKLVENRFSQGQ